MSVYAFVALMSFSIELMIGSVVFYQDFRRPLYRAFVLTCLTQAGLALLIFMQYMARDPETARFWLRVTGLWPAVVLALIYFVLLHVKARPRVVRAVLGVLGVVFGLCAALFVSDLCQMQISRYPWGFGVDGVGRYVGWYRAATLIPAMGSMGMFLTLAAHYFRLPRGREKQQTKILCCAFIMPVLASNVSHFLPELLSTPAVPDLVTPAMTLQVVLIAYAIRKYRLFDLSPSSAATKIIETMKDGLLLLDPDGVIVTVNRALCQLWECREIELVGKPLVPVLEKMGMEKPWTGLDYTTVEIAHRMMVLPGKERGQVFLNLASSALYDGANRVGTVCLFSDITEMRKVQGILQEQKDWLEVTLTSIGDAVMATDGEGKIVFINQAAEMITGWKAEEARQRPNHEVFRIIHEKSREPAESPIANAMRQGAATKVSGQILLVAKDGREVPIDDIAAPIIGKNGQNQGAVLVFRDISAQKQSEARLRSMQEQLLQSEKLASLGQLSAGVAHEINNPTGYVLNNLEALSDYSGRLMTAIREYETALNSAEKPAAGAGLEFIRSVRENQDLEYIQADLPRLLEQTQEGALRIKKIVMELKDFAHPPKEQYELVDINEEIEKALTLTWNELKYHCQVVREMAAVPAILCNRSQVSQVLVNLLVNAAQAIPQDRQGIVTVRTFGRDGWVHTEIEDNGVGIPEKNLPRLFEPFFTTKPVGKGTGLGLSIAYGIIRNHGAEMQVKSREQQGATFIIRWPAGKG